MALEANAYTTTTASSNGVIPQLYNEDLQKYQYAQEILRPLGWDVTDRILGVAGNDLKFYKGSQFSMSSLTQGTDTPISALSFTNVDLTVSEYGDAKQIPLDTIEDSMDFVVGDISTGFASAFAECNDSVIMTALLAGAYSTAIYPISSGSTRYTSSTIATGKGLTKEQFTEVRRIMQTAKRNFKVIVIHPFQMKNVLDDTDFIDNSKYPAGTLISGAVGTIYGVQVMEHTCVASATENTSVTVYKAVALGYGKADGQMPFVYGYKRMPVIEMDREYNRKRAVTFHAHYRFGAKVLQDTGVIVVKSA